MPFLNRGWEKGKSNRELKEEWKIRSLITPPPKVDVRPVIGRSISEWNFHQAGGTSAASPLSHLSDKNKDLVADQKEQQRLLSQAIRRKKKEAREAAAS